MTANEIRKRRDRLGYSQQQLAERAGVSIAFVQQVEAGWRPRRGKSEKRDRIINALEET